MRSQSLLHSPLTIVHTTMLLCILASAGQVLALSALIVVGKAELAQLFGLVLPASGRTILIEVAL